MAPPASRWVDTAPRVYTGWMGVSTTTGWVLPGTHPVVWVDGWIPRPLAGYSSPCRRPLAGYSSPCRRPLAGYSSPCRQSRWRQRWRLSVAGTAAHTRRHTQLPVSSELQCSVAGTAAHTRRSKCSTHSGDACTMRVCTPMEMGGVVAMGSSETAHSQARTAAMRVCTHALLARSSGHALLACWHTRAASILAHAALFLAAGTWGRPSSPRL
jgi:hypothetical protein